MTQIDAGGILDHLLVGHRVTAVLDDDRLAMEAFDVRQRLGENGGCVGGSDQAIGHGHEALQLNWRGGLLARQAGDESFLAICGQFVAQAQRPLDRDLAVEEMRRREHLGFQGPDTATYSLTVLPLDVLVGVVRLDNAALAVLAQLEALFAQVLLHHHAHGRGVDEHDSAFALLGLAVR